ncbi:hypothetical protein PIB30_110342, partial [Stylosanthes scabra]|nr:hypothetical protein [Stylosanthes scabra]
INSMATAMRDSTAAMRESAAATDRAMEHMGRRNGNADNDGGGDEIDNGIGGNNKPMTLATFLKVNPPSFSGATTVTKADDWFREMERSLKYLPPSARTAKELELLQLKQGNMTVAEYTRKFEDLCRFSRMGQGNLAEFEE